MRSIGLRGKLALVALVLLALPWAGVMYVNEMERVLLDGQERNLLATARAVATALHDRPQLLNAAPVRDDPMRREAEAELRRLAERALELPAEQVILEREQALAARAAQEDIAAILKGVERTESRIWVVNRKYQVLALAGSLKKPARHGEDDEESGLRRLWRSFVGALIQRPSEEFAEAVPDDALASGRDIGAALQGAPGTRVRRTPDGRAIVMSAASPIWNRDQVVGAVVVEETTNPIATLRSGALERLLVLTLTVFAGAAAVLLAWATRLSLRIRRLRDEAESAIDARGRFTRLASGSNAGDEIGDLSRSFSAVLGKLAQHHAYLESMAGRLSHELRTPIAVVRSSLENLKLAPTPEESRTYIARAEEGLARLSRILERMGEANRLEQGLSAAARERFDAVPVVRGCVEGYRMAYAPRAFDLELPGSPTLVDGAPDLLAQMLDKLAENAADFAAPGTPVRVSLAVIGGGVRLIVENEGPPIPEAVKDTLFGSMVSGRAGHSGTDPHLGLGLYVARLIAEFHGGGVAAENLSHGVRVTVTLP
ncbi:MAG: ATP-binding protein [Betaproteobacteria bacterium]